MEVESGPTVAHDLQSLGAADQIRWKDGSAVIAVRIRIADRFWDALDAIGIAIDEGRVELIRLGCARGIRDEENSPVAGKRVESREDLVVNW